MPTITITNGMFSKSKEIVEGVSKKHGLKIYTDKEIINLTSAFYDIKAETLQKAVNGQPIAFDNFTHEKERCIACLRATLSRVLKQEECLIHGVIGHLIPADLSQVLKVLVITDKKTRIENAVSGHDLTEKEAAKEITESDGRSFMWTGALFGKNAWAPDLYDIVIPTDKFSQEEALNLIGESFGKISGAPEEEKENIADFAVAADVAIALAGEGSGLSVLCHRGHIDITIDRNVLMLARLKDKLVKMARGVSGVTSIDTKIGKNFYKADVLYNFEFELAPRVLLVDDEKEFVHTLSERLKLRDVGVHVVYGGREALDYAGREEPEVMVLDLKMPGIDGFEVLKTIKETQPHIEVIILTGHGSDDDRKRCLEMGAFAYLNKPADIDLLTETMKEAYKKINTRRMAIGL